MVELESQIIARAYPCQLVRARLIQVWRNAHCSLLTSKGPMPSSQPPHAPSPQDPSPAGPEAEPVGEDEDEDEDESSSPAPAKERDRAETDR